MNYINKKGKDFPPVTYIDFQHRQTAYAAIGTEDILRHFAISRQLSRREVHFLRKASILVETRLEDATFNVDEFASRMLLSRTQLYRKLKEITNLSVTAFVRSLRLRRAAFLLREGMEPVSQIAYQVGFNNLSYFARCFKEQNSCSPSAYRSRHQLAI